jgi:hypothetical protein
MQRRLAATALKLDFGEMPLYRRTGLRLAAPAGRAQGALRGPEKYLMLDLKRRRAQIRARRELGLT